MKFRPAIAQIRISVRVYNSLPARDRRTNGREYQVRVNGEWRRVRWA